MRYSCLGSWCATRNIRPKADIIALTQALRLAEEAIVNVYIDSRYACAIAHVPKSTQQGRGLFIAEGKPIKNKEEILALLEAL